MRRIRGSLSGRILLAALATGIIASLVSAAISIVVINRIVDAQARSQLHARVAAMARLPEDRARSLARLAVARERFAVVAPDGRISGRASGAAGRRIVRIVLDGGAVSRTLDQPAGQVILEAVPSASGGGVIGLRPVADVRAGNQVFLRGLLLALAAGVAAALLAGFLAGRRVGAPLGALAADARRLARGERGLAITPQPVPEIDDIASALRTLDTALTTSESRQREFLLSISHELRTPLTALRGYAEALADGVVPASDLPAVGRTMVAESDRLGRFTSDLLELARLEAEDFRIEPGTVSLDELLAPVDDAWRAAAARTGASLEVEAPRAEVRTDPQRLRQLVDGLIENALRVTPEGGTVRVTGFAGDRWGVEVSDDGPGLDDADLAVAFDRGVLRDRWQHERPVGTGLGLSIARRLASRMGGRISARRGTGHGTVFRVEFPAAAGLPDPDTGSTET